MQTALVVARKPVLIIKLDDNVVTSDRELTVTTFGRKAPGAIESAQMYRRAHLEHARLRPGRGFRPLRAALYYAQRGIVQPTIRSAITAGLAAAIRWRHPFNRGQGDSIWHAVDRSAILRTLDTDGIAVLPERLSVQVAEMKRFLRDRPLVLRSGELVDRKRVPPGCTMADYQLETVLNCPHVLALANSDFLIRTATQYIGCLPTISTLRIWWTFPGSERQEVHSFHRDREDWRGLTVFVYLGDVDGVRDRIILYKEVIEPGPSGSGERTRSRLLRKTMAATPSASSQALPGPRS